MNKNILTITITFIVVFLSSCKKEAEVGGTAVQSLAGDWFVEDMSDLGNFYHLTTYNTAANLATEMWLDDNGSGWTPTGSAFKGKISADVSNLTFSATNATNTNTAYPITLTIKNGKIIKKGTKGPESKSPTDSIYFEVVFSSQPTTTYKMSGYKRTGFEEDEH